ncbi:hypothetical protein B0J11DRAFT_276615 [Dendryphion nanum]|uniref:Cyclin-dependent kinase n=1 Tax=Dendryphion nanum TaxID=256645 RepID=A0A9P9E0U5_9PLEO|nr:hypothetical protein B0J11DRAFT_276615 [Dendryphion nanum]
MLNGGHALSAGYPAMNNNISTAHPTAIANLYSRDITDPQDSYLSAASSEFTAPGLLSSSSNISNSTAAETDFTSPSITSAPSSQAYPVERYVPPSPTQSRSQNVQTPAPRINTTNALRTGDTAASPMSLDSPSITQGSKRTASGVIKSAVTGATMERISTPPVGHKRSKSTGSNTKIGELSAQLKTRLSYAMVKVQNGWEKQSLEELEDQASQRGSPTSLIGTSERPSFDSPRPAERLRRQSGVSEISDRPIMSPGQGSPRYSGRPRISPPLSLWPTASPLTYHNQDNGPVLAPPAEIGPRRKRRSSASHAPPPLLGSTQRKHYSDLGSMSTPRTPNSSATPRAGILRMPSQQAEKDAVDTLLFMSSPKNSGRVPHAAVDGQPQPSPLRSEFPARRVMFDHTAEDKVVHQPHHYVPNGQQAYYQRHLAR